MKQGLVRLLYNLGKRFMGGHTHDNVCSSMLSCFFSHLLSTGRPISSYEYILLSRYDIVNSIYKHPVDQLLFSLGAILPHTFLDVTRKVWGWIVPSHKFITPNESQGYTGFSSIASLL